MPAARYAAPMRGGVAVLIFLLSSAAARAEAPVEFCTDRPGLTTGLCLTAPGTFQLETSLVEWAETDGQSEMAIAASVLRYGVSHRTDLHLGFTPYLRIEEDGETHHGAGDVSIAVKHVLTSPDATAGIAVMPFVKLPTASRQIGNGEWEGGLLVPVEMALSESWSLTFTPEFNWNADGDENGHHPRFALAATLAVDVNERWSASIDGLVGRERDGGYTSREAVVSGAIAYLMGEAVQVDVQADVGLARDSPDIALTSGIAFRF